MKFPFKKNVSFNIVSNKENAANIYEFAERWFLWRSIFKKKIISIENWKLNCNVKKISKFLIKICKIFSNIFSKIWFSFSFLTDVPAGEVTFIRL